jgi:hypothetical protein
MSKAEPFSLSEVSPARVARRYQETAIASTLFDAIF